METSITGRDLYVRITDSKGNSHINHHRVWDGMRFFERLQEDYRKAIDPAERCKVEMATEAEYKANRTNH